MANRVEYIKISRIDENGNDLTNTLEALTQLTIPYSNGNNAVYPIESITKYSDYFLYQVGPANYTPNSADAGKLEYKFTSSISTNPITHYMGVLDASSYAFYNIPLTSPTNDPFGFYDENAQVYKFDTYSQKDLTLEITSSLSVNNTLLSNVRISVFINNPNNPITANDVVSGNNRIATQVYGLSGNYTFNKTITIPSESIAPGNEIKLIFSNGGGFAGTRSVTFSSGAEYKISSTAATGPTLSTIPEPYLTSKFYGGDCDVLLNNVELYQENPFLQDLDYSTNPNVPINFELIISGTAARGTVPESYYTSLAQTTIRYIGSKNQSSDFNIYDPQAGTSSLGDPINIGTYGQTPSISDLDANIYEFEWGGGTTPEILDYGAIKIGRILQASSKDLVKTINPSDGISSNVLATFAGTSAITARDYRQNVAEGLKATNTMSIDLGGGNTGYFWLTTQSISDYTHILNGNNPVNHEISMYMYPNSTAGSNPTLPNTTKILNTQWGVPTISNYALTSSNSSVYGTIGNIGGDDNLILLNRNIHISKVTTDSNGFYQSAPYPIKPNWATIGDQIVADLQNGEKWFVTLYNEFEFPNGEGDYNTPLTSGSLSPYNKGYTTVDSEGNYSNPLAYKGVHEIIGAYDNFGNNQFFILLKNPIPSPTKNIGGGVAGNSLGMLIWKARATDKGEFVLVQDSITGGVQAGAFTSKYAPGYITENFESITKEYGSNQTG